MTFRVLNQAALVEMWTENQQFTNRVNHNPQNDFKIPIQQHLTHTIRLEQKKITPLSGHRLMGRGLRIRNNSFSLLFMFLSA